MARLYESLKAKGEVTVSGRQLAMTPRCKGQRDVCKYRKKYLTKTASGAQLKSASSYQKYSLFNLQSPLAQR